MSDVGVVLRRAVERRLGQQHGERVLTRPELARVQDGRWGHIETFDVHAPVHHLVACKKGIHVRQLIGSNECILNNRHDRTMRLRRNDVLLHRHKLSRLNLCLNRLRHVQIHFITVKLWYKTREGLVAVYGFFER